VRLIVAPRVGVSAKRNHGFRDARADVVLFMGDDILGARSLVARHIDWHQRHPEQELGVLGHVRWARELEVSAFMRWLDHGPQFDYPSIDKPDLGWGRFWTANLSLKRAMLERVGGFDESYIFAYEDLEIGMRLYEAGFHLLYEPRARAEHLHPTTLESWKARMATVAVAERRFCAEHLEVAPYFYNMFSLALRRPPSRGRLAAMARWVPKRIPIIGPKVWSGADWYFAQQLAPTFMAAWENAQAEAEGSLGGSKPGGSEPGGPK
jgi:GT2 family glycosyltransferase